MARVRFDWDAAEAAGLVVLEGLDELGAGVHHERAVGSDGLADRQPTQDQHLKLGTAGLRRLKRRQLWDRREHPWPVADRSLDPVEDIAGLETKPPRPTEVICPTNRLCLERQCPPKPDREPQLLPSLDG